MAVNRRKSNDELWTKTVKPEITRRKLRFNGKSLYIWA